MSLAEENIQILNLVQAMIGAISPNFRRVTIELPRAGAVCLRFLLEKDDPEDREEIDDIAFEFEALQMEGIDLDVDVTIDSRPSADICMPGRVVFGRREC